MGILDKLLVGAGVATASLIGVTKLLNNPKKRLEELDRDFKETCKEYETKKAALLQKISKGDSKAEKKLKALEASFKVEKEEYEEEREEKERAHTSEMEKLEAIHAMEMEKLEYQKLNNIIDTGHETREKMNDIGSIVCASCGFQNSTSARFCSSCGKAIEQKKFCSNCGQQLSGDSKFCTECGEKL